MFANDRVLIIHSYHPQYAWSAAINKGITEALRPRIKPEHIYIEYLDNRRFVQDQVFVIYITQLFRYKYQAFKPDVIIASDDYALQFLLKNPEIFGNTPTVYGGISVHDFKKEPAPLHYTGISEGSEIWGNLLLIKQILPNTKTIYLLSDHTPIGASLVSEAEQFLKDWEDETTQLDLIFGLTHKGLYQLIDSVDENDAILLLTLNKLADGTYFSFSEDLKPLTIRSKAPFFGMIGAVLLGQGVVGGWMSSPEQHGRRMAGMALEILDGTAPKDIPPIGKAEFRPAFDYEQLSRFNIDHKALPPNSLIVNQPRTIYSDYKNYVLAGLLVVLWLISIIIVLVANVKKRQSREVSLSEVKGKLEEKVALRTQELSRANKQLSELNESTKSQALTDFLTQLPNRRAGNDYLQSLIEDGLNPNDPLSIALIDIDHFHALNTEYGHTEGDRVLIRVAQLILQAKRSQDFVCRWGGEEFLFILNDTQSETAQQHLNQLRTEIEQANIVDKQHITVSVGLATSYDTDKWEQLHQAETMLYKAKTNGRNRLCQVNIPPNTET